MRNPEKLSYNRFARFARFAPLWCLIGLGISFALSAQTVGVQGVTTNAIPGTDTSTGASIYLRGITGSGAPLRATREVGNALVGQAAACVNCHRRSGLGGTEGRSTIPPITGRYLFRPGPSEGNRDVPYVPGVRGDRPPYTDATLARAIRDGLDVQGKPLSYLMPNFDLSDADMAALIGYLRSMDPRHVPGVNENTLHFATIITPDADRVKRQGMLDVINQFFSDRNVRQFVSAPRMTTSGKTSYSKTMFRLHQKWELHVWDLTGDPQSWQSQLDEYMAQEPVFAVISGLGGSEWGPVHAFCDARQVPCLFPNIELPVDSDEGSNNLYFSKGVLLEAQLIASSIANPNRSGEATANQVQQVQQVQQIYRAGDVGAAAAKALSDALRDAGFQTVHNTVLAANAPAKSVRSAVAGLRNASNVILWLRPEDLAALPDVPPGTTTAYLSGLMGDLENAPLSPSWRTIAHMAYPVDLPQARRVRVDYAMGWFHLRNIKLSAPRVQADTYLACGLLSEALNELADAFVPAYLIESTQSMLAHRVLTGYYPRLSMANAQHFASKGGYMVRFSEATGNQIVPEGEWSVP